MVPWSHARIILFFLISHNQREQQDLKDSQEERVDLEG